MIESSGKDSFQIGSEDWGDPSSSCDDVALSGIYPKRDDEGTRPPFCKLIPHEDATEYGYAATLRVNVNHVIWDKATLGAKGNRELMEQLVQMQLAHGCERDAHSQYLTLQTASLKVSQTDPEDRPKIEHKSQSALPYTLSADVAVAFDGASDLSLPELAKIGQEFTHIDPKDTLRGIDLSKARLTAEHISALNLDPDTHQGATLVTEEEMGAYSRDPEGFERKRAFEAAYRKDQEMLVSGTFEGGTFNIGGTYTAEEARTALAEALDKTKEAFETGRETLEFGLDDMMKLKPLDRLPSCLGLCTEIHCLMLSHTKITSLEPIRDMKNLNFLNLTETPVTDLRPLVPLLRKGELRVEGVDDALLDAAHTAPPD